MKKILGILGGIILLLIIVAVVLVFVTPSDYKVEREITINKPKADVFSYIKLLKNQNDWGPWIKKDPAIKLEYKGTDGQPGFISSWESKVEDVGVGEQEIKKITEGSRIDSELRFKKPFESTSQAYMITEDAGPNATKVKWGFTGSMPKPTNLILLFMNIDKAVGKDFEEGLANLKAILEK
jgi:hypothetical protein